MSQTIFCKKLNKESEPLASAPFPGPLGEKIFQHISKAGWQLWLEHQTILINEYRLSLVEPKARQFLNQEMEKFLFGEGSDKPEAFTPDER